MTPDLQHLLGVAACILAGGISSAAAIYIWIKNTYED